MFTVQSVQGINNTRFYNLLFVFPCSLHGVNNINHGGMLLPLELTPSLRWPVGTYGQPYSGCRACSPEYLCF